MDILEREGLLARAAELEDELYQALLPLEELPVVDHVRRGVGALAAVQMAVGDDETLPYRAAGIVPGRRCTDPGRRGWRASGIAAVHHDPGSGVRDGLTLPGRPRGYVKQSPFWVEEHPRPENITSDLPGEADVLIVGSGLTGLTAALRLSRGGKSVVVVDSGEIASGASSVNGGMVSPDIKAGIKVIFEQFGPELGKEMWQATVRSVDIVSDLATSRIDRREDHAWRHGCARDWDRCPGQVRAERLLVSGARRSRLGGARARVGWAR